MSITSTPYDDVFRTLLNDHSSLIIPVINEAFGEQYTGKEEIFAKDLLFLIPFYIFSHESRFEEYEKDEIKRGLLMQEYGQIKERLEGLLRQGRISEYMQCTIIDMTNKVLEHIAARYGAVRKGVRSVMGGKILDYEAKAIKREGIYEGKMQILFDLVDDGVLTVSQAATKAGLTEDAFRDEMQRHQQ